MSQPAGGLRLVDHPRARRGIRTAAAWGGLAFFAIAALAGHRVHGVDELLLRCMIAGWIGYLGAWAIALAAWRQIARSELEQTRRLLVEMHKKAEEAAERVREQRTGPKA